MSDNRQFSGACTAVANISGREIVSPPSQLHHASALLTTTGGTPTSAAERAKFRSRRRAWIVTAGHVPATVPMWNGRTAWRTGLEVWRHVYPDVLRRYHLSARMLRIVAPLLAEYADSATGRNCAVSNQRIARRGGCSTRTVSTVRAVLAVSGFGLEARRGTGSPDTPFHARRVSVWHLISRRPSAAETHFFHLPPRRDFTPKVPLGSSSPSEAHPASPELHHQRKRRRAAAEHPPRTLHTQRLAGWLASTAIGLGARDGRHVVGQLCAALERSHLELDAWTGPHLVKALDADMAARKISWPDRIDQPGAFLAGRLRHLPARPPEDPRPTPPPAANPDKPTLTEVGRQAQRRVRAMIRGARPARPHRDF